MKDQIYKLMVSKVKEVQVLMHQKTAHYFGLQERLLFKSKEELENLVNNLESIYPHSFIPSANGLRWTKTTPTRSDWMMIEVSSDLTLQVSYVEYQSLDQLRDDRNLLLNNIDQPGDLIEKFRIEDQNITIGGKNISWFQDFEVIDRLYCFEPMIQGYTPPQFSHQSYHKLIEGLFTNSLHGYPLIRAFSLKEWCQQILNCEIDYKNSKIKVHELTNQDLNHLSNTKLFNDVKDNQLISPKLEGIYKGSIEFKNYFEIHETTALIALIALRLGITYAAVELYEVQNDYHFNRKIWWENLQNPKLEADLFAIEIATKMMNQFAESQVHHLSSLLK